jgi:hypothetical protein
VLESSALAFRSRKKTNRVDVRERDFLEIAWEPDAQCPGLMACAENHKTAGFKRSG